MKLPMKPADLARAEASLRDIRDSLRINETALADNEAATEIMTQGKAARDARLESRRSELERRIDHLRSDEEAADVVVSGLKSAFAEAARVPLKTFRREALVRYADALNEAAEALAEAEDAAKLLHYIGEKARRPIPAPYLDASANSARELASAA